jgi:hypothetical protein
LAGQARGDGPLSAAVADVASGVALALGEGGSYALSGVLVRDEAVALAVIRVLGADVLAPYALDGTAARGGEDGPVIRRALAAYPPGADASEVSAWSYHGLVEASRAYLPGDGWPVRPPAGDGWVRTDPWPRLAHRASLLAALSLPGLAPALAEALAARTDDLARGFVRAVRRRDWLQAAGLGRWLARAADTPQSLGLDSGLAFVRRMSGGDARVALAVAAAHRFHGRGW